METSINPADLATRGIDARTLAKSEWLRGPDFLRQAHLDPSPVEDHEPNLDNNDPVVKPWISAYVTSLKTDAEFGSRRFERFSSWSTLQHAIANLINKLKQSGIGHARNCEHHSGIHTEITCASLRQRKWNKQR